MLPRQAPIPDMLELTSDEVKRVVYHHLERPNP
jgi:hypothetical protein